MFPNHDSKFDLIIFSFGIVLFIIYMKYFQVNNQHEEMDVLSSWKWVQAHRLRTKGPEVRLKINLKKLNF